MIKILKPSSKGIKNAKLTENDRFICLEGKESIMFDARTLEVVGLSVLKSNDSHTMVIGSEIPVGLWTKRDEIKSYVNESKMVERCRRYGIEIRD